MRSDEKHILFKTPKKCKKVGKKRKIRIEMNHVLLNQKGLVSAFNSIRVSRHNLKPGQKTEIV